MFSKNPNFKHPAALFGIIALCIGLFLLIVGIVIFVVLHSFDETFASILVLAIVGGQGLIWLSVGLIITGINRRAAKKLWELRDFGDAYEAEEIMLIHSNSVYINYSPAVHAECIYINSQGQRCKVKSRMFMWNRWGQDKENLRAMIYVDRQDPSRYAVEMMYAEQENQRVDVDYT